MAAFLSMVAGFFAAAEDALDLAVPAASDGACATTGQRAAVSASLQPRSCHSTTL